MTTKQKNILAYIGAAPLVGAIVVWGLSTAFVPRKEFQPVKSAVDSLYVDLRAVREGLRLSNCLALSEKQGRPWQECLR